MIRAEFYIGKEDGGFFGFFIKGHSYSNPYGEDIVCSAVSSAVMLTINTVADYFKIKSVTRVADNKVGFKLLEKSTVGIGIVESLYHHLKHISEEYGYVLVNTKIYKKGNPL